MVWSDRSTEEWEYWLQMNIATSQHDVTSPLLNGEGPKVGIAEHQMLKRGVKGGVTGETCIGRPSTRSLTGESQPLT